MTKKDYVLIADSIIEWYNGTEGVSYDMFARLVKIISQKLENDNSGFDNRRFTRYIIEKV